MKKEFIYVTIGLLIALSVLFLVAGNNGENSPADVATSLRTSDKLVPMEASYNFGNISMRRGNVSHDFVLTNTSSEALLIKEVSTSCMCTEAWLRGEDGEVGPFGMSGHGPARKANFSVQPGEQFTVKVEFDPAAHGPAGVGTVGRNVYLKVDTNEQVVLDFTATVTP